MGHAGVLVAVDRRLVVTVLEGVVHHEDVDVAGEVVVLPVEDVQVQDVLSDVAGVAGGKVVRPVVVAAEAEQDVVALMAVLVKDI